MVATSSLSISVSVFSPLKSIWVSSRMGAAVSTRFSNNPVIPGNPLFSWMYAIFIFCIVLCLDETVSRNARIPGRRPVLPALNLLMIHGCIARSGSIQNVYWNRSADPQGCFVGRKVFFQGGAGYMHENCWCLIPAPVKRVFARWYPG